MTGPGPADGHGEDGPLDPVGADAGERAAPEPEARPDKVVVGSRAARRRAQRPETGRAMAICVVVAVVLGVGLLSVVLQTPSAPATPSSGDGVLVARADAHASSLYCVSGAGTDAGAGATETVILTNTTRTAAHGFARTVGTTGASVPGEVTVPPLGSVMTNPAKGLATQATATTYSFTQGGVTATAVVQGPKGWSMAPCASTVSSQWNFAGGSTNAGLLDLSLYNPTAAQTVVGVTFLTASGTVLNPQAYQGIVLPPGTMAVEGLGAYVQEQPVVATLVSATSGALVATELDQMTVASGTGLALLSGAPAASDTWHFAQTTVVQGGSVTLALANPNPSPVTVTISAGLPSASVEPQRRTVPARTVASFVASSIAGWPLGTPYSMTVSSTGPIVVGRTVLAPSGAASPQGGITPATTTRSNSWLIVAPGTPGTPVVSGASLTSLSVVNPGTSAVEVTIRPIAGGRPIAVVRIPASGVVVLGPSQVSGLNALIVTATGPVEVETDNAPTGAPGIVASSGFALGS